MAGIWEHAKLNNKIIPENYRFSLGEGFTPLLDVDIAGEKLKVKNENANPNGSFKDRSLAYQVSYHVAKGEKKFVLSSSGNAAISAAAYVAKAGVDIDLFVGKKINPVKLERIENYLSKKIRLHQSLKPKSEAIKYAKFSGAIDLRGSLDDLAAIGFKTIAYELATEFPEIDAIFIPCSSGTSTLGVAQGFAEMHKDVRIFICQTAKVSAIAKYFDKDFTPSPFSLADAIVDRIARRKKQIVEIIKQTGGGASVISDQQLKDTKELLAHSTLPNLTFNSLLGFAGYLKIRQSLMPLPFKYPVILATGT